MFCNSWLWLLLYSNINKVIQEIKTIKNFVSAFFNTDTFERKLYNHIEFKLLDKKLESNITYWGYNEQPPLSLITVIGMHEIIKTVKVNGKLLDNFNYDFNRKVIYFIFIIFISLLLVLNFTNEIKALKEIFLMALT